MAHRLVEGLLPSLTGPGNRPVARRLGEPQITSFERRVPAAKHVHRLVPEAHRATGGDFFGDEDVLPYDVVARGGPGAHRVPIILDVYARRLYGEIEVQDDRAF